MINMMEFLVTIVLFSLSVFFVLKKHITKHCSLPLPPGPKGLPLIGSLHDYCNSIPHQYFMQLSQKYGPLMSLRLGFRQALVVSSAKMAEEVLKTHDLVFCSRPSMVSYQKLSYNNVDLAFAPYGDYWREMRKVTTLHFFSAKRVNLFTSIREDEVFRMVKKIYEFSISNKIVNLSKLAIKLTSTIVRRIAFGKMYDHEEKQENRFDYLSKEAEISLGSIFLSDFLPLMGWVDKMRGLSNRLEKTYKNLNVFYEEVINEHLDPKRTKQHRDILDILLAQELTRDHIKGLLMNIFIAASDTSSILIVWAMTMLVKNPRVMIKVRDEIRKSNSKNTYVNECDLQQLPYLVAVIKETLRFLPPAPLLIPRKTRTNCQLNGYHIPQGTLVFVNAHAIGRDPEAWECPNEFYPERFLEKAVDFRGQDFELIPFGAGRRICPGMHMGVLTSTLALANLLHNFDWEMPKGMSKEDIDFDVIPGISVHKKNPLCLAAKSLRSQGLDLYLDIKHCVS